MCEVWVNLFITDSNCDDDDDHNYNDDFVDDGGDCCDDEDDDENYQTPWKYNENIAFTIEVLFFVAKSQIISDFSQFLTFSSFLLLDSTALVKD